MVSREFIPEVRNLQLVPSCGGSRFLGIRVTEQRRLNSASFGRNAPVLIREIYLPKVCSLKASASGKHARIPAQTCPQRGQRARKARWLFLSFFSSRRYGGGNREGGERQRPERIRQRDKMAGGKQRKDLRQFALFSFASFQRISLVALLKLGRRSRWPKRWTEECLMLMKRETYLSRCLRTRVNSPRVVACFGVIPNAENSLNDYFDNRVAIASARCVLRKQFSRVTRCASEMRKEVEKGRE